MIACGVAVFALERIGYRLTMIALLIFMLGVVERKRPLPILLVAVGFAFISYYVFRDPAQSPVAAGAVGAVMPEVFNNLMLGFSVALQPSVLAYAFAGCVIGTLVGMLPGLGPLAGISLLLPATFGLNPIIAIVLLAGVY